MTEHAKKRAPLTTREDFNRVEVFDEYPDSEPPQPEFAELTFLGTGTSCGVPDVSCSCATCTSHDPRDKRLRSSAYLSFPTRGGLSVLIDAGPDLRTQALAHGICKCSGCVLTHSHSDHIGGMSDLREFNRKSTTHVFATDTTLRGVRRMFGYIWDPNTAVGGGLPKVQLHPIKHFEPFVIKAEGTEGAEGAEVTVTSFPVMHGALEISGYVFEWAVGGPERPETVRGLVYITDGGELPEESERFITAVRPQVFVVNALRYVKHPTHWTVAHAVMLAEKVRPRLGTYLIHMNHFRRHCQLAAALPPHIQPAFDNLTVLLPLVKPSDTEAASGDATEAAAAP